MNKKIRIAIVLSKFNENIGKIELESCLSELYNFGLNKNDISIFYVPGALELGVAIYHIIQSQKFNSIIALGAVIRGDTYHFDIVSNEMASAISTLSLNTGIPIANGVLTVDNEQQALLRAKEKGIDCAKVAVEMFNLIKSLY
ncbi:6,7-dimethyl-8-ribityllumazine synthase [Candidatus Kinetoplastibacterium sorsogonicusi]|uniref:6,7-dimethyl-8-ribityllumazine synthase n=1 Tax=Candidatus Kinetoplastidibacterium kentomonadis TaxID=1576550 RepID=A0A3Q8EU35_9PROT|nr:6,7-dimethyl-8-ribityllumazine synthase [Candidatus Kinetoplastibacterium sorsogonicusi]AWD32382.1 6,7-dimethyl-8-ribityllumazine synthase [Candidatus Kinetoplastibacterium sorsogonicusi]